ncbi:hypothetical protein [Flavobacterium wongokense]|uniref:hypothetical protein n=1 Tax=Flavobacterium wongokense TaxID=2910674 RepID=UPI001F1ADDB2|nr:hypothetical protein [Flavobacterium sp. WG47]MCF6131040.1 hypothetical protein [Flavobacterium sp. WG47]
MMKKLFALLLLSAFVTSCSEDGNAKSESADILGQWKVIEILVDPGDGSGTFEPYTEDWKMTFSDDGHIYSYYSLCDPTIHASGDTFFGFPYIASANRVVTEDCFNEGNWQLTYELVGENLILHYPFTEEVSYKFVRVAN